MKNIEPPGITLMKIALLAKEGLERSPCAFDMISTGNPRDELLKVHSKICQKCKYLKEIKELEDK